MAPGYRKRPHDAKSHRPVKKQKRRQQYHSDSEEEEGNFKAVNLLEDSDEEDVPKAKKAAKAPLSEEESEDDAPPPKKALKSSMKAKQSKKPAKKEEEEEQSSEEEEDDDEDDDSELDDDDDLSLDDDEFDLEPQHKNSKSKRNDPGAFATSLSKILSTKLSTSKRADPVLARSAAAHETSKAIVDNALEAKARRQMRQQKRDALEKGRVKDVLVATTNTTTGEFETTTGEIMETERRLRKTAQRGVVRMFNAVRAAQVAAHSAEKGVKKDGVLGIDKRAENVNTMTQKGFLDFIASGGGLSKKALEEA